MTNIVIGSLNVVKPSDEFLSHIVAQELVNQPLDGYVLPIGNYHDLVGNYVDVIAVETDADKALQSELPFMNVSKWLADYHDSQLVKTNDMLNVEHIELDF